MPSSNQGGRDQRPGIPRGFASTDPERQRETADPANPDESTPQETRAAGRPERKPAHRRTTAQEQEGAAARETGRKGGDAGGRREPGAGSRG